MFRHGIYYTPNDPKKGPKEPNPYDPGIPEEVPPDVPPPIRDPRTERDFRYC